MKKVEKIIKTQPRIKKRMNKIHVAENFNQKKEIKKIFSKRKTDN